MKYEMKLCVIKISVNSRLEEVLNQVTCRSEMDIEVLQSFEEFSTAAESGCLKNASWSLLQLFLPAASVWKYIRL